MTSTFRWTHAQPSHWRVTRSIALLMLTGLLQGCMSAAIVAGSATAVGTILYDARDLSTIQQDRAISAALQSAISDDISLSSSHVRTQAINHHVLIFGQVPSFIEKTKIQNLAQDIPHVRKIYNQLTIDKPASHWQNAKDTWLTAKVKAALLNTPSLRSLQISVSSSLSTVYLIGILPKSQAQKAASITANIKGVKRVVRLLLPMV